MGLIKRILVPLDGSRLAESLLPIVESMAHCLGARITLLHIIEEKAPPTVHGEPHLTGAEQAEAYLEQVAQKLRNLGYTEGVEHHVHNTEEHDVAGSIASHVAELEADMVALCTHGRGGLHRVISGSIAQQVLRRVSIPVLLVRPSMQIPGAFRTILVPLDGLADTEAAIPVAMQLARSCGARLHLVTVVPTPATVTGDEAAVARLIPNATAAALDVRVEQIDAYLASLVSTISSGGVRATMEVKRGDTVQNLVEMVTQVDADLIVLATHGRSGLGALWIGSVAWSMIDKVERPLLLVRIGGASALNRD
jgi:nucleotide-binding universal stress UspA family protein